jgi:PAS domain S-box-containing protein
MTITPAYAASDILATMSDSLILISPEGNFIEVNNSTLALLGYTKEELIGSPATIIFPEGTAQFLDNKEESLVKKEFFNKHQIFLRTKEGEDIPVIFSVSIMKDKEGDLLGIVGVARDMREILKLQKREKELTAEKARTETLQERALELQEAYSKMRKAQSQLIQSEKMAAVGKLAGGVAHEINNPMGVILGFAQSIMKRIKEDDPLYMPLKSIEREAVRCRRLVGDLLTFSRVEKTKEEEVDINHTIDETLSLIKAEAELKNVEIIKKYQDNLPLITANKNQLQQVIVNLCNNAIDAMPDGGKIKLSTKETGDQILIEVADTGKGITEEVKKHLFEPFFTTKEADKGTGFGLSLCNEIIQKHKGTIEVQSEQGRGTIFIIKLPVSGIYAEG